MSSGLIGSGTVSMCQNIILSVGWHVWIDSTRENLMMIGICQTANCPVCDYRSETAIHLFFEYHYSSYCLQLLLCKLQISCSKNTNTDVINWIKRRHKRTIFQRKIIFASIGALVYRIWLNKNKVVWEGICENPCTKK